MSAVAELEVIELTETDEARPCHISRTARATHCWTIADHDAEVTILWSCGHAYSYCRKAAEIIAGNGRSGIVMCTQCKDWIHDIASSDL